MFKSIKAAGFNLIRNLYYLVTNKRPETPTNGTGGPAKPEKDKVEPPPERFDPLFPRLDRAVKDDDRDVRVLQVEDLHDSRLADELIGLMFDQRYERGKYTTNWLVDALAGQSSLDMRRRAFYIYVDEKTSIRSGRELRRDFYARLFKLSEKNQVPPLYDYLNAIFVSRLGTLKPGEVFKPEEVEHCAAMPYFMPCLISVHPKKFPPEGRAKVFIVGRSPLHDVLSIERREEELSRINTVIEELHSNDSKEDAIVKVAATVRAYAQQKDRRVSFNAHYFQTNDARTRLEQRLYIGDWPTDCEISIGSAEHDEIQCAALGERADKATLRNIFFRSRRWDYTFKEPETLPPWFSVKEAKETPNVNPESEGVHIGVKRNGSARQRLYDLVRKSGFIPEVRLTARVLPTQMDDNMISYLLEATPRDFRDLVEVGKLSSIMEVYHDIFWLARTERGEFFRLEKRNGRWVKDNVRDGEDIAIGEYKYTWRLAKDDIIPPRFCGILYIDPPDNEKPLYAEQLAVDVGAEEVALAFGRPFPPDIHPDATLGTEGVVRLKCVSPVGGRPAYELVPVPDAVNEYFAFEPAFSAVGQPARWLVYDDDDRGAEARRASAPMVAVGANNNLICGTSFFHVKTSVTPDLQARGAEAVRRVLSLPPGLAADGPPEPESDSFNPLEVSHVKARLMGTRWATYDINVVGRSNVAAHYTLINEAGDRRFFKVFKSENVPNAEREVKFYEHYRGRAAELFLRTPDDVLYDRNGKPWALVLMRLQPFERTPTLAQVSAVACAMTTLLDAMDADGMLNYDIHPTMLCLDESGRLVIVDFDNVFPVLSATPRGDELAAVRDILLSGELPTGSLFLPPEVRTFHKLTNLVDRQTALSEVGVPYGIYLLAVMLAELGRLGEEVPTEDGWKNVRVLGEKVVERAVAEGLPPAAAERFGQLLQEMLHPVNVHRPERGELLAQLRALAAEFAGADPEAEAGIFRLLGGTP